MKCTNRRCATNIDESMRDVFKPLPLIARTWLSPLSNELHTLNMLLSFDFSFSGLELLVHIYSKITLVFNASLVVCLLVCYYFVFTKARVCVLFEIFFFVVLNIVHHRSGFDDCVETHTYEWLCQYDLDSSVQRDGSRWFYAQESRCSLIPNLMKNFVEKKSALQQQHDLTIVFPFYLVKFMSAQ